jgi:hypothetical protein
MNAPAPGRVASLDGVDSELPDPSVEVSMLHGRCLRAGVHSQVDGSVEDMTNCHCGMFRKAHGAARATFVAAQAGEFHAKRSEELVETHQSSQS